MNSEESFADETGLTRFWEGTLARIVAEPLNLETLANPLYRGFVGTVEAAVRATTP